MPQNADPAGARLAEIRKNWDAFGDGDATPALTASLEAVLDVVATWTPDTGGTGALTQAIREAISRELLRHGGDDAR